MSRSSIKVKNLPKWQQWLSAMERTEVTDAKDRILRTTALRTQEYLDDLTPVRSNRLRGSYSQGHADNIFKLQVGKKSYFALGTAVDYAVHVNDGHQQQAGRFIPGEWRSGTFHYQPGFETGMVLTGKVIPGARMFDKATKYTGGDIPTIIEFEFRRLYDQLF